MYPTRTPHARRRSISPACGRRAWPALLLAFGLPLAAAAQPTDHASIPTSDSSWEDQVDRVEANYQWVRQLVRAVGPSVVHIEAQKTESSPQRGQAFLEEAGAGVVLEFDGRRVVVTNRHVIVNANREDVRLQMADGRFFHPVEIRSDRDSDLAVLIVDQPGLRAAKLGDSDRVEVGDFVLAVGSPFGLNHSVTTGIISGKGRRDLELGTNGVRFQDFLQTDAAINPGNSGGPLVNLRGELIGINTAIASNSGGSDGIGFSIPANVVRRVARELVDHGYVRRGFLGVSLDAAYDYRTASQIGLHTVYGARVSSITPNSPASGTGLQVGDVILKFDGRVIENDSHLVTEVSMTPIGTPVDLEVYRNGEVTSIRAVIEDRERFQTQK